MISVSHRSFEQMAQYIGELETLTSQPGNLTKKQEQRHAFLLAAISALKSGSTPGEIRRWEEERLLAAAGLRAPQHARTRLPEEVESEWRSFVRGNDVPVTLRPPDREVRANEAGTQTISFTQGIPGGYFVPQGMHDRAFETMKKYDAVFDDAFCNVVETDTGSAMPFPSWDDVANASVQVGETVQSTEVDVANFGSVQLNAYSFRSKIVAVSLELLQDSNFPWGAVLERVFAMRHARGVGQALVTGSGVAAPTGLLTAVIASGAVPVVASGSSSNTGGSETGATSLGTQDLNSLYAKLDPAYRPGAAWFMNDASVTYLQGLLDKMGRPIVRFRDGLDAGVPYVLGKPIATCPSMPTMGSGKNSVLFGNPFYFVTRRVPSSMYVRRFWQSAALVLNGLVGFESWLRVDSNLVAPNQNYLPFQFIQQHS
jgi:HK97 family phage major capsid protein